MPGSASRVLITGTTSGLGRALVDHYVKAGAAVVAVNRRHVPELAASLPSVRHEQVDVRRAAEVEELIQRLATTGALPEVFILNAGINRVDNDESFQLSAYHEVMDTNLYGVLNFVAPLTRIPATRAPRHVIAISSMAGVVGNPYGLGYHTSKKALSACFATWARMYEGTDLLFQQVVLGPVQTGIFTMEDRLPAWMVRAKHLVSASPTDAAQAIAGLALTRRKRLIYPPQAVPLYLAMGLGQRLIPGLFQGRKTLGRKPRRAASERQT
jgi:NAD(P)-dependent dehydrogenase (short-subunit alcohol dehydrogenase family)